MLSLVRLANLPRLLNNKKKIDNETSDSVDWSLQVERTLLKFITKAKNKINKDSLFNFFPSSKCVKIL